MARKGFSLLELLVAIGIIALLIGLIFPLLSRSKDIAKGSVCLSRINQISVAAYSYATDGDGFFVPYQRPMNEWAHIAWDQPAEESWWTSDLNTGGYITDMRTWRCPDFDTTEDFIWDLIGDAPPQDNVWNRVHYGYNVYFLGSRRGWKFPPEIVGAQHEYGPLDRTPRMEEVKNPVETISHTDSKNRAIEVNPQFWTGMGDALGPRTQGIGYLYPGFDPPEIQFGYSDPRHAGTINVGYVDGHATSVAIEDPDNPYGPEELTSVPDQPYENLWDLK